MLSKNPSQFREWLQEQGWKPLDLNDALYKTTIENLSVKPDALMVKDGIKIFFWFCAKGTYPFAEKQGTFLTGLDWTKYEIAKEAERTTKIQSAIVFKSEWGPFVSKQLNLLPKPIKWFAGSCAQKGSELELNCFSCWKFNKAIFSKCRRRKMRPLAMWRVSEFVEEQLYIQPTLI